MYCWSVVCRNETWDVCVQLWRISPISGSWKIIFRRVSERDLTFSGLLVFIWNPASHQVQRSGLTLRFLFLDLDCLLSGVFLKVMSESLVQHVTFSFEHCPGVCVCVGVEQRNRTVGVTGQ